MDWKYDIEEKKPVNKNLHILSARTLFRSSLRPWISSTRSSVSSSLLLSAAAVGRRVPDCILYVRILPCRHFDKIRRIILFTRILCDVYTRIIYDLILWSMIICQYILLIAILKVGNVFIGVYSDGSDIF